MTLRRLPLHPPPLPLLLLFISGFLLSSESADMPPNDSTGKTFLITFPESIAYFFPSEPSNKIQVIAVLHGTDVTATTYLGQESSGPLSAGQTKEFVFDSRLELGKETLSNKTIQITSNRDIAVYAISKKNSSLQTALITPTEKLGTNYLIPSNIQNAVNQGVTEKTAFRLIILNADGENKVTVKGNSKKEILLSPNHVAQVWLNEDWKMIEAEKPVAVFFGHPCILGRHCTCGLMYTALQPTSDAKVKFFIPSFLTGGEDLPFVVLPDSQQDAMIPYKPALPVAESAGTAILYWKDGGLLLTLVPESDFASCYAITPIPDTTTYVVIVVHKDQQSGIHVGKNPLEAEWMALDGTDYVSTRFDLMLGKNIIWHASSKMAVYFMGEKDGRMFGNPAPIISTNPDFRGCALASETLLIGDAPYSWRGSLAYCSGEGMKLVCPVDKDHREQIYKQLARMNSQRLPEVWIGMRRSSLTGEWYWVNGKPVQSTDWGEEEPGTMEEGQCTMMNVENDQGFFWRDADCCKKVHPVCIKEGSFLPL